MNHFLTLIFHIKTFSHILSRKKKKKEKAHNGYQGLFQKEKKNNTEVNDIKISQKMKNKQGLVKYRKNYYKVWENKTVSQIKTD